MKYKIRDRVVREIRNSLLLESTLLNNYPGGKWDRQTYEIRVHVGSNVLRKLTKAIHEAS